MALQVRDYDSVLNAAINSQIESFHFEFSPTAAPTDPSGCAVKIKCIRRSSRKHEAENPVLLRMCSVKCNEGRGLVETKGEGEGGRRGG